MKTKGYLLSIAILNLAFSFAALGQIPSIASFAPKRGPIGTSVTITGSNFSITPSDNIVYFGATKATVSASTATTLTVNVPPGATYQPITVTVGGLTAYSGAPFVVTFNTNYIIDESTFASKVDFATGLSPFTVAIGDLDGDGKADIATTNAYSANVSVLKNTSSPKSLLADPRVDIATGYVPYGMAIGDLDGDGMQDIVVIYNGNTISIFKNTSIAGSIDVDTFAPKVDFLIGYNIGLSNVAIRDLDQDGKPDLIVTEQIGNKILIFKNTTLGGTIDANSFAPNIEFETGPLPKGIAIADLDGDGKPELTVANENGNSVSVFKNTSVAGTIDINSFSPKVDFVTGPNGTIDLAVGDLDGDGKPDIVVSNYFSNTISILKNITTTSAIAFAAKIDFATGIGPQTITMSDLDGDGKPDLAVANFSANITDASANKISVFKNQTTTGIISQNSFAPKIDFSTGQNPVTVVIGDIDGDGKPDLVATNYNDNTISILRNKDSQTITTFESVSNKNTGDPSFLLSSTSSSGLPAQFTSSSDKVAISGSQVTVVKAGKVTIYAEQPGNDFYSAAPKVPQTFCIMPSKPAISVNITDPAQPVLTSSSDIGNTWYQNENLLEGATEKTLVVKEKGIYKVKVDVDGCIGPISEGESFIITGDVSTNASEKIQFFPNPVHDLLTIQLSGFKENVDVSITMVDGVGKTIVRQIGKGGQELTLEVKNYGNGPYYLIMRQGSLTQQAKFIKN